MRYGRSLRRASSTVYSSWLCCRSRMRLRCCSMARCKSDMFCLAILASLATDPIGVAHFGGHLAAQRLKFRLRANVLRMIVVVALRRIGKLCRGAREFGLEILQQRILQHGHRFVGKAFCGRLLHLPLPRLGIVHGGLRIDETIGEFGQAGRSQRPAYWHRDQCRSRHVCPGRRKACVAQFPAPREDR